MQNHAKITGEKSVFSILSALHEFKHEKSLEI